MDSQEHNMVVFGQIFKHIPAKLIEKLKNKHKIQTRSFPETSHVAAMIFAQLSHALSLNDGNLPCFVVMSNGKMSDIRAAKENISIVPDSIYTFDKGYYDLGWFKLISDSGAFFVTRVKDNAQIEVVGQHREANTNLGVVCDEIIRYTRYQISKKYPDKLRLTEFFDEVCDDADSSVMLQEAIKSLAPRERQVMILRYYQNKTMEEVSLLIGRTRERVRQIQRQALAKLKLQLVSETGAV